MGDSWQMIEIKGLNKTYNYKKSNAFQALKGIDLTVEDGEMLAIIGRSGAGKSTLMHIIGCIDGFESGEYNLNGNSVTGMRDSQLAKMRNQEIGIVMQDFALIEEDTVLNNVMAPLYFSDKAFRTMKTLAMDSIKNTGIEELAGKKVKKLSGGQKQRVAIARAMVTEPSILLADEPTGALDTVTTEEIMNLFLKLNENGTTVIIITHDMDIASKCKRIVEISDGKIV